MAGTPSLQQLAERYDAEAAQANDIQAIPGEIVRRVEAGDTTGSALADFTIQRAAAYDGEAARMYRGIEEKLREAAGETVLVITERLHTARRVATLRPSLAAMEGGAYLPHEAGIAAHQLRLPTTKSFYLGKLAAGGPQTTASSVPGLFPRYDITEFSDAGSIHEPVEPWLIPTEEPYTFGVLLDRIDIEMDRAAFRLKGHGETIDKRVIPVFDFMPGADPQDGFPSALGRTLRSRPMSVAMHAAKWSFRETLRTDVLIGQAEIDQAGYEEVQAALVALPEPGRGFD